MGLASHVDSYIWLNGEFVHWENAKIHCFTHTLHYGFGVLEGVRTYNTKHGSAIFRLEDHTDRLFRSAKILNIPINYSKQELNLAQKEIIRKNNLSSAYIRPMVFHGSEHLNLKREGLSSNLLIGAWELNSYFHENAAINGVKVGISSFTRNHPNSIFCKAKANGNYMNSILAVDEANNNGYDDAIFLDHRGYICEGSAANIFIVRNNVLYTPYLISALEGITRDTIFTLAKEANITVIEKDMSRDEIYTADEAFFTGTAIEITPICEVDNKIIGSGQCGNITRYLRDNYLSCTMGKNKNHLKWLSVI